MQPARRRLSVKFMTDHGGLPLAEDFSKGIKFMGATETKRSGGVETEELDVILVGAGFAGFYLLDRLRGMGLSVQLFEAGDSPGGVWY